MKQVNKDLQLSIKKIQTTKKYRGKEISDVLKNIRHIKTIKTVENKYVLMARS